jgi:hypothetical protein
VVQATCPQSVLSKPKQTESRSSITLNIPTLKPKVRSDSEKENDANGYSCVSSLQSLKLKNQVAMRECDLNYVRAPDECDSPLSLAVDVERQGSRVFEPQTLQTGSQFSSLAELANKHSSEAAKLKLSERSCLSPITQFANIHVTKAHDQSSQESNFSSLAQLAERHNKVTKLQMSEEGNNFPSLSKLGNRQELKVQAEGCVMTLQELVSQHQQVQSTDSVSCLADMASQHLKVHKGMRANDCTLLKGDESLLNLKPESCSTDECIDLRTCLTLSAGNKLSESSGHDLVMSGEDQKFDCSLAGGSQTGSEGRGAELSVIAEKMGDLMIDCETSSETGSNVMAVEQNLMVRPQSDEESEVNWEIDLTWALMSPGSKSTESFSNLKRNVTDLELGDEEQSVPGDVPCEAAEVVLDYDASFKILNMKLPLIKRKSSLGRILCRKWKKLYTPYTVLHRKQSLGKVVVFTFDTASPDDKVLALRRRK